MKHIKVGKRDFAIVDDCFEWLSVRKWDMHLDDKRKYARTRMTVNGKRKSVSMHRLIMQESVGLKENELVDHRSGDSLDNRMSNLRKCTPSQNCQNRRKRPGCSSIYKGVTLDRGSKKKRWRAWISIPGTGKISIGYFKTEKQAARAYNIQARKYYGEFARLNCFE